MIDEFDRGQVMFYRIDEFLFCCIDEKERKMLAEQISEHKYKAVYELQHSLIGEKKGIRCKKCGELYPYRQLMYNGKKIDIESVNKTHGLIKKYRKASIIFKGDHYYSRCKNHLEKYVICENEVCKVSEVKVTSETMYYAFSDDEKYVTTATLKKSIAVIDLETGETIAKKRIKGNSLKFMMGEDCLVYFLDGGLYKWDFLNDNLSIIGDCIELFQREISDMKETDSVITCKTMFYDSERAEYVIEIWMNGTTMIARFNQNKIWKVNCVRISNALSEMTFDVKKGLYIIPESEQGNIYDMNFNKESCVTYPTIDKCINPVGWAPVSCFTYKEPNRIYISSDGTKALLDYFTDMVLLDINENKVLYYLFDPKGKTFTQMGFLDENSFWYSWGDTTYVQSTDN